MVESFALSCTVLGSPFPQSGESRCQFPKPYSIFSIFQIFQWDQDDPWNKDKWETQHGSMQKYDPPLVIFTTCPLYWPSLFNHGRYVYHVHKNNYTGFVEAIRTASQTEISAFIPEFLTEKSVRHRVQTLMETDWKAEAVALLEQRMKEKERGKKPYVSIWLPRAFRQSSWSLKQIFEI